jgi:hypothetical protein
MATTGSDVKSTVRMVHAYERIGASAILIEDRCATSAATCGHGTWRCRSAGDRASWAALAERTDPHTMIVGRTDIRRTRPGRVTGRAQRFVELAEGFRAGLRTMQTERVGRSLQGVPLLSRRSSTPGMPWPAPAAPGRWDSP